MDLREFALEYTAKQANGVDLIDSGPASQRLFERIGNEGRTRSLLATAFWKAWLASDIAGSFMKALGATQGVFSRSRTIVVSIDDVSRFDLVVLDPSIPRDIRPKSIGANLRGGMTENLMRGAVRAFIESGDSLIGTEGPQLAAEVSRNGEQPFSIVLACEPAVERLSVPSSPLPVTAAITSTAGMLVEDLAQSGRFGVTAALHAIDPATTVMVGSQSGTVIRTDTITDSAFIELSPLLAMKTRSVAGVMSGMTPRGSQNSEFIGHTSKICSTVITGWDVQIPSPSSRRQACVYTRRDAQPGDSGSALVTDDDWIVGFAFERTKPGETPENCSWVWAESVLNRLSVKMV